MGFLCHSSASHFWGRVSIPPELTCLTSQLALRICVCFPRLQLQTRSHANLVYTGFGDPDSFTLTCRASALTTESIPQQQKYFFNKLYRVIQIQKNLILGMARCLSESNCLPPSLMTQVQSPGPTWQEEGRAWKLHFHTQGPGSRADRTWKVLRLGLNPRDLHGRGREPFPAHCPLISMWMSCHVHIHLPFVGFTDFC